MESTEVGLALAVLKGDMVAAAALADLIVEKHQGVVYVPVTKITVPVERCRVIIYVREGYERDFDIDKDDLEKAVVNWLKHGITLGVMGIERIEIYEL